MKLICGRRCRSAGVICAEESERPSSKPWYACRTGRRSGLAAGTAMPRLEQVRVATGWPQRPYDLRRIARVLTLIVFGEWRSFRGDQGSGGLRRWTSRESTIELDSARALERHRMDVICTPGELAANRHVRARRAPATRFRRARRHSGRPHVCASMRNPVGSRRSQMTQVRSVLAFRRAALARRLRSRDRRCLHLTHARLRDPGLT